MRKELLFPYLRSCRQTLRQGDRREVGQLREVPVVGGRARAEVERLRRRHPVLGLQHGAERRPRRKRLGNGFSMLMMKSPEANSLTFHSNSLSGVDLGLVESSIFRTCFAAKGLLVVVAGVVAVVVV